MTAKNVVMRSWVLDPPCYATEANDRDTGTKICAQAEKFFAE